MKNMHKLVFLVVILGVIALSVGCQSGLSEEEVRSIVREEVTNQLATMDELTVSELLIENEDGDIVGGLAVKDGRVSLVICNADGDIVAGLGSSVDGGGLLTLTNADGGIAVMIGSRGDGGGFLGINNPHEDDVIMIFSSSDGNGMLAIKDKDGQVTFIAP